MTGGSATRNAHSLQHPVHLNAISVDILRITFLSCWKGVIFAKFKYWYQSLGICNKTQTVVILVTQNLILSRWIHYMLNNV